jgi:hypothetical protein
MRLSFDYGKNDMAQRVYEERLKEILKEAKL